MQYIPVREDLVVDLGQGSIVLQSVVGPFSFDIRGETSGWEAATGQLGFQFRQVDIRLLGNKVWTVSPTTSPKTYTWYYVSPSLAAARSSAGGLSLLVRP